MRNMLLDTYLIFVFLLGYERPIDEYKKPSEVKMDRSCYLQKEKNLIFIGTPNCLSRLPAINVTGYIVLDHEYSVFYKSFPSDLTYDSQAYWLEINPKLSSNTYNKLYKGRRSIYKISGRASLSERKGVYGNGDFSKAVFVHKFDYVDGPIKVR